MKIALEDDKGGEVLRGLIDGIKGFNKAAVPGLESNVVTVAIRDGDGVLHGGAVGRIALDSMYVEVVWNDDCARGKGLGTQAMQMLEAEAKRRGAAESWLYTMSFQAKPFYEKLGYAQFAELPWDGGKQARHFMRKDL